MTIVNSGEIRIAPNATTPSRSIASEFGGNAQYELADYYAATSIDTINPLVPNWTPGIPQSGEIRMSDFYGTSRVYPVDTSINFIARTSPTGGGRIGYAFNPDGTIDRVSTTTTFLGRWMLASQSNEGANFQIRARLPQGGEAFGTERGSTSFSVGTWLTVSDTIIYFLTIPAADNVTISTVLSFSVRRGGSSLANGIFTSQNKTITAANS